MVAKITSIAELKKAIEKLPKNQRYITEPFYFDIIDLINSFEASVKERIEKMENSGIAEKIRTSQNRFELRRVFGGE